ncbi:MAG: hypothetical protein QM770_00975 [Tepidisphaeraceae bacterium]
MLVDAGDELLGLGFVVAVVLERPAPRGQEVPPGAAAGLGVGRHDFNAILHEVAPIPDALGVALADEEDDRAGVRRAVVLEPLLPVGVDELGLVGDGVDVVAKGERDDVGLQAVDDRPGLLAAAAVRDVHFDVLAGLGLPVLGELGVEVDIEFARGIVADVEQRDRTGRLRCRAARLLPATGQSKGESGH